MGDIIRIHRANIGTYKGYKTFSVNLAFGSAWAIFSGIAKPMPAIVNSEDSDDETSAVQPRKASSKDYSLGPTDVEIVTKYRVWLKEYFQQEFEFEGTLFMALSRVKDTLLSSYRQARNL